MDTLFCVCGRNSAPCGAELSEEEAVDKDGQIKVK